MAQKQRTRAGRVFAICAWASIIVVGVYEMMFKDHGEPHFLTLLQLGVALIAIAVEVTGLLQEPN